MEHHFVDAMEKALGWIGPEKLGKEFVRGALDDPGLCARILTPSHLLDLVMRRSLTSPQFRVFQGGSEIHPSRFLEDATSRRGQSVRIADMRRLGRLLRSGCTLVLDQTDFFDPTMEVVCRALQWWSRELVQVNAYLTTQATEGFPLHWDDHEVVIVQLAGDKDWEVRRCSRVAPMYRDAEPNDTPPDEILWSGTLHAGEIMHLPRGYWHRASRTDRGDGFSLHATFGFVKRTGVSWLTWLADQSRREELFRHDLERDALHGPQQTDELLASLTSLAAGYPIGKFLESREYERETCRHVPELDLLGDADSVVCVADFPPRTENKGEFIEVISGGRRITFAPAAAPALEFLLSGAPAHLGQIRERTGLDVAQLAKILMEEEICAPLTPELSSGYTGLTTNGVSSKSPTS